MENNFKSMQHYEKPNLAKQFYCFVFFLLECIAIIFISPYCLLCTYERDFGNERLKKKNLVVFY
jgi:hypothetical protein